MKQFVLKAAMALLLPAVSTAPPATVLPQRPPNELQFLVIEAPTPLPEKLKAALQIHDPVQLRRALATTDYALVIQDQTVGFLVPRDLQEGTLPKRFSAFLEWLSNEERTGKALAIGEVPAEVRSTLVQGILQSPFGPDVAGPARSGNLRFRVTLQQSFRLEAGGKKYPLNLGAPLVWPLDTIEGAYVRQTGAETAVPMPVTAETSVSHRASEGTTLVLTFSRPTSWNTRTVVAEQYSQTIRRMVQAVREQNAEVLANWYRKSFPDYSSWAQFLGDGREHPAGSLPPALQEQLARALASSSDVHSIQAARDLVRSGRVTMHPPHVPILLLTGPNSLSGFDVRALFGY